MYLGLDLGTTNIKALVVNDSGKIVTQGSKPVSLLHTDDGGVEQNIEEIWQSTLGAIQAAGEGADLAEVKAIGVSSQGAAIQIRSPDGRCFGPVISWMDARGRSFDERFAQQVGEQWLTEHTGHGVSAMVIGQVMRLRQSNPALLEAPNVVGFVGDTIVQRLCGRAAHDGSSLSIASLYNPSLQQTDPDLLEKLQLGPEQVPQLLSPREPASGLAVEVAKQTGLATDIPVSPAIHDQYAASVGCGALHAGDVMFGAGTAWALLAIADHLLNPVGPAAWVCNHIVPGLWGQLLSLVVGGSAFKWSLDLANLADASNDDIDKLIDSVSPGCEGLRLWPFLDGVGGQNRPVGGRIYNVRLGHGRGHLVRATLEGLCFELTRQLGWLENADCPINRLVMCGGASRSRVTPQMVADVTGRDVTCPLETKISAFGAAILARAMLERDASLEELFEAMGGETREVKPSRNASTYVPLVGEYIEAVDDEAG